MKTETILLVLVLAQAQALQVQTYRPASQAHPVFRGQAPVFPEPERQEQSWLLLLLPVLFRLTARRQPR